jgi:hypothetical protein
MQLILTHSPVLTELTQHLKKGNFREQSFFKAFCERVLCETLGVRDFVEHPATFSLIFGPRDICVNGNEAAVFLTLRGVRSARHTPDQLAATLAAAHLLAKETIVATEFSRCSHWKRVNLLVTIELDAPIVYKGEVTSRLDSVPEWVDLTLTAVPERGDRWP